MTFSKFPDSLIQYAFPFHLLDRLLITLNSAIHHAGAWLILIYCTRTTYRGTWTAGALMLNLHNAIALWGSFFNVFLDEAKLFCLMNKNLRFNFLYRKSANDFVPAFVGIVYSTAFLSGVRLTQGLNLKLTATTKIFLFWSSRAKWTNNFFYYAS